MQIPAEYKGPIYFYTTASSGGVSAFIHDNMDEIGDWIKIGSVGVDVKFDDVRDSAIAALEEQIKKERAESRHRIDILEGKIKNLQALEHQEA